MAKRVLAVVLLWTVFFAAAPAGEPVKTEPVKTIWGKNPVPARVGYQDTMLVLVSDKGAAAVVFQDAAKDGTSVRYQFRYESRDGTVKEGGSGVVFERYKKGRPTGKPGEFELINDGSETKLTAGPLAIEWSASGEPYGWVYYVPEEVHLSIAKADDYKTLDLKRFFKVK